MAVHPLAEAFAHAVADYEQGRPEYPGAVVEFLRSVFGWAASSRVVEVAAGSGKFTRSLERGGVAVVAVEPIAEMRLALHRRQPTTPVLAARAEQLPVRTGAATSLVVAQAFHWFQPDVTVREFARVLAPGGGLGLVWNVRDETVPWVGRFGELIRAHEPASAPQYRSGAWKKAFEGHDEFTPLRQRDFSHGHELTPEGVVARALSVSYIAALPPLGRTRVAEQVRELLRSDPATHGRDRIPMPLRAEVYWTLRRGSPTR